VSAGKIIAPVRIGEGTTRWRAADLHEWIDAGCPHPDRFRK
jgi:predicted DNA-binding transcriptional regulator AlpA